MPACHICGRATVLDEAESDYSQANLNICARARCEPERQYLKKQRGEEMMEHWAIINRFAKKARAAGGSR